MRDKKNSNLFYLISLALQLGFSIAVPLALFVWVGVFLDRKFSTSPLLTILFTLFSFIVIFFETQSYLLPLIKKKH